MKTTVEKNDESFLHLCAWQREGCEDTGVTPEYIEEMRKTIVIDRISHGVCRDCAAVFEAE